MEGLKRIVQEHPFFAGLSEPFIDLIAGCAKNVVFETDQYLFQEGQCADQFYLIRSGHVALQYSAPERTVTVQTVGEGDVVGASWLVPPYRWVSDAKALERTRALVMDATCLRGKSEADHELGYEMMKRFMPILIQRLHATRLQILDVYRIQN
jgi:CRP-like cAMP-binding protein